MALAARPLAFEVLLGGRGKRAGRFAQKIWDQRLVRVGKTRRAGGIGHERRDDGEIVAAQHITLGGGLGEMALPSGLDGFLAPRASEAAARFGVCKRTLREGGDHRLALCLREHA